MIWADTESDYNSGVSKQKLFALFPLAGIAALVIWRRPRLPDGYTPPKPRREQS